LTQPEGRALRTLPTVQQRIAYLARREQRHASTGRAIGQITIPEIGASYDVVQGTDGSSLEKGPGHYPGTPFPGLGQTVGLAGHRATYLAPLRHIDALELGDRILLKMPCGLFIYVVQYRLIALPTAVWVTRNVGYERLVLSAGNSPTPRPNGSSCSPGFVRLRRLARLDARDRPIGVKTRCKTRPARSILWLQSNGRVVMNAARLKEQIEKGEYRVDSTAVADALLRRLGGVQAVHEVGFGAALEREANRPKPAQNECSYPASSERASRKTTPGGPSTTSPIQVRSSRSRAACAFTSIAALAAGTQTHSS
jgi:LPXTG-site transpeptidase (sortase) family protein